MKIALLFSSKAGMAANLNRRPDDSTIEDDEPPPTDLLAECDSDETINAVAAALRKRHEVVPIEADVDAYERLRQLRPDLVFNIAERLVGPNREAHIPTICEILELPYTGSDPLTLSLCLDKSRAKEILSYFVNNRVCYRQRFYFWQSLVAPVLAGLVNYAILRWVTGLVWRNDQLTSVLIFFIALVPSFPIFAFLYAFFGGWDDDTLEEVHRAASLASFMKPLAWLFWAASILGARISPLHGRFPIGIRAEALREARDLQEERVSLV